MRDAGIRGTSLDLSAPQHPATVTLRGHSSTPCPAGPRDLGTSLTETANCDCIYSFFCLLLSQSPTVTCASIWTIYLPHTSLCLPRLIPSPKIFSRKQENPPCANVFYELKSLLWAQRSYKSKYGISLQGVCLLLTAQGLSPAPNNSDIIPTAGTGFQHASRQHCWHLY